MDSVLKMSIKTKNLLKRSSRIIPKRFFNSGGVVAFEGLSDVDFIGVSFVLDIISELNKEEAG